MENITNSPSVPPLKTAVALGVFDGIHRGHQAVISKAICYKDVGLSPCVFTFDTKSVTSKGKIELIISDELKFSKFEKMGVEYVYSPRFEDVKNVTPEDFVKEILLKKLNCGVAVCGENFHFGKGGSAGCYELSQLCEKYGIKCEIIPFLKYNGKPICSTDIRELIKQGDIKTANEMLGYDFHFKGRVVKGNEIGRTLNFPTINQYFEDRHVIPRFGVYASVVNIKGKNYMGVSNIGVKPTVSSENKPLCETFVIDFNDVIYGQEVTISLKEFIRAEQRFDSLEILKEHIALDLKNVKHLFNK